LRPLREALFDLFCHLIDPCGIQAFFGFPPVGLQFTQSPRETVAYTDAFDGFQNPFGVTGQSEVT
jgi:hypothetical protein